jgi:hypothetical protein
MGTAGGALGLGAFAAAVGACCGLPWAVALLGGAALWPSRVSRSYCHMRCSARAGYWRLRFGGLIVPALRVSMERAISQAGVRCAGSCGLLHYW